MKEPKVTTIAADGTASVTFTPKQRQAWQVNQIAISSTSVLTTTATVTHNGLFDCQTQSGNADTCMGPLVIVGPDTLTVTWTNGTPNAQCTAVVDFSVAGDLV